MMDYKKKLADFQNQGIISKEALNEIIKESEPLKDKHDIESRIKKLELNLQGFYHGWVAGLADTVSALFVTYDALHEMQQLHEKIVDHLSKLSARDENLKKEFEQIKKEMDEQGNRVVNTLQPIKELLDKYKNIDQKPKDFYG